MNKRTRNYLSPIGWRNLLLGAALFSACGGELGALDPVSLGGTEQTMQGSNASASAGPLGVSSGSKASDIQQATITRSGSGPEQVLDGGAPTSTITPALSGSMQAPQGADRDKVGVIPTYCRAQCPPK